MLGMTAKSSTLTSKLPAMRDRSLTHERDRRSRRRGAGILRQRVSSVARSSLFAICT